MGSPRRRNVYSAKDLAGLPGMPEHPRSVQKMAKKSGWAIEREKVAGGDREVYPVRCLPEETRLHIARTDVVSISSELPSDPHARAGAELAKSWLEEKATVSEERRIAKEKSLSAFSSLPEERQRTADARFKVLRLWQTFVQTSQQKVRPATKVFAQDFAAGRWNVPDWIRDEMAWNGEATLTYEKLHRWDVAYREFGSPGLVPGYRNPRKGESSVLPTMRRFIEGMILHNPRIKIPRIMDGLRARFHGQKLPHPKSVERFVTGWKEENEARLLFATNPDEFRSKLQVAFGDASEGIAALNEMWEVDSTPADVLLSDGRRHTILGAIDVYSRRLKLLVSRTSTGAAVCALMRRAILDWGVPGKVKSDNGTDYVSRRVEQVLADLEVPHLLCPPFTPEAKPHIERALGTFSHGIVELLAGYIGHSVGERKAIEARKSFAERLMKRGEVVEIRLTAEELQTICDRWTAAIYHENPHDGLGNKTPAEVARAWTQPVRRIADERALDVLLMPAPDKGGTRKIGKEGFTVERREYIHAEFGEHVGERVLVRLDDADLGRAYVYSAETRVFLCVAECPEWTGISRAEVSAHAKAKQKALQKEWKKANRAALKEVKPEAIAGEILVHRESLIENVTEFPRPSETYTTPALEEAAAAGEARDSAAAATGITLSSVESRQPPPEDKPAETNVVEMPPPFFADEVQAYAHYEKLSKRRPLTDDERDHLRELHRESGAVRNLMRIEVTEGLLKGTGTCP